MPMTRVETGAGWVGERQPQVIKDRVDAWRANGRAGDS